MRPAGTGGGRASTGEASGGVGERSSEARGYGGTGVRGYAPCVLLLRLPKLALPSHPSASTTIFPPRPIFRPFTIRTARDTVTAVALYLRWLGYRDVRRADHRQPNGIGLAARGVLVQVDPSVRPAALRDVECLWLTAMTESAGCVYFSLAGYATDARDRADGLGVSLFALDLAGTPQPVNSTAVELVATGAGA